MNSFDPGAWNAFVETLAPEEAALASHFSFIHAGGGTLLLGIERDNLPALAFSQSLLAEIIGMPDIKVVILALQSGVAQ